METRNKLTCAARGCDGCAVCSTPSDAVQAPLTVAQRDAIDRTALRADEYGDYVTATTLRTLLASPVAPQAAGGATRAPVAWEVDPIGGVRCITVNEKIAKRHNARALVYADAAPVATAAPASLLSDLLKVFEQIQAHPKSFWDCTKEITAIREVIENALTPTVAADAVAPTYDGNHVENHCPECSEYESECSCVAAQPDERAALPDEVLEALTHAAGGWRGAACMTRDDEEGERRSADYNQRAQVIEDWLAAQGTHLPITGNQTGSEV